MRNVYPKNRVEYNRIELKVYTSRHKITFT